MSFVGVDHRFIGLLSHPVLWLYLGDGFANAEFLRKASNGVPRTPVDRAGCLPGGVRQ